MKQRSTGNCSGGCGSARLRVCFWTAWLTVTLLSYVYIWNRVTLQTAEHSTLANHRPFLPVAIEGRLLDVTSSGPGVANYSSSGGRRFRVVDVHRKYAWSSLVTELTPDGTPPVVNDDDDNDDDDNEELKRRSLEYCNSRRSVWTKTSAEGKLIPEYRMIGVIMILRHGDRSPMYTLPNHASPRLSCSLQHSQSSSSPSPWLSLRRQKQRNKADNTAEIDDSNLEPIRRFFAAMQSIVIDNSSVSAKLFRRFGLYPNSTACYGAQLTTVGAIQMFWLGHFLKTRYPNLAGSSSSSENLDDEDGHAESDTLPPRVYVRSTEYSRTFQSAAALLYGFAGRQALTTAKFDTTRNIYFCSESNTAKRNESCSCPAAAKMLAAAKKNRTYSPEERKVRDEIAQVFNVSSNKLPWISAIMEVYVAYVCHRQPLPCGPNNRCITWRTIDRMWTLSDINERNMVDALHNLHPFPSPSVSESTPLTSYSVYDSSTTLPSTLLASPLLREIAQRLLELSSYRTRQTAANVVIFSGHDKTLSTAAEALGVFDRRWPPYGSRMVFELHASANRDRPRYFIRLLYNGRDVTSKLSFCRPSDLIDGLLCPLENFTFRMFNSQLSVNGERFKTRAEACNR